MVLPQKIFGLDSGQSHLRNLVESQSLVAVAFQSEGFQGTARDIATRGGKTPGDSIRDADGDIHILKVKTEDGFRAG